MFLLAHTSCCTDNADNHRSLWHLSSPPPPLQPPQSSHPPSPQPPSYPPPVWPSPSPAPPISCYDITGRHDVRNLIASDGGQARCEDLDDRTDPALVHVLTQQFGVEPCSLHFRSHTSAGVKLCELVDGSRCKQTASVVGWLPGCSPPRSPPTPRNPPLRDPPAPAPPHAPLSPMPEYPPTPSLLPGPAARPAPPREPPAPPLPPRHRPPPTQPLPSTPPFSLGLDSLPVARVTIPIVIFLSCASLLCAVAALVYRWWQRSPTAKHRCTLGDVSAQAASTAVKPTAESSMHRSSQDQTLGMSDGEPERRVAPTSEPSQGKLRFSLRPDTDRATSRANRRGSIEAASCGEPSWTKDRPGRCLL